MSADFYKTLGVEKGASESDIKKAYRKLAQEHHPDKGGNEEKFKEINEAYETLKDPQKKASYDQFGQAGANGFGGGAQGFSGFNGANFGGAQGFNFSGANFDFSDLGDIFGGMFGGAQGRPQQTRKGRDIRAEMTITFEEMAFGTEKKVHLDKLSACEKCQGTGAENAETETCSECDGTGRVEVVQNTILGRVATAAACQDCQGTGQKAKIKCSHCGGVGRHRQEAEVIVKIPAGIEDGQSLRLSGHGEAGEQGAEPGDLYIRIHIQPDSYFIREDKNIRTRNQIDAVTATLGGTLEVRTINGIKKVKIPAGTQPGKTLIIKSEGLKPHRSFLAGDHLIEIEVQIPEKLSSKEKKIWEELRK